MYVPTKLTIKQWRLLKELSQAEFAKIIGISTSSYQMKEAGKREWTGSELIKISKYLDKSLENEIDFSK